MVYSARSLVCVVPVLLILVSGGCGSVQSPEQRALTELRKHTSLEAEIDSEGHVIEITASGLDDQQVAVLSEFKSLTRLNLSGCEIGDDGIAALKGLTLMQVLQIDGTRVSDIGLDALAGMTRLRHLNLSGCPVSDEGLKLSQLRELRILNLSDTDFSGT